MIVVHYKCDRCGRDDSATYKRLPRGWVSGEVGVAPPREAHYCSEECALPPRFPHPPYPEHGQSPLYVFLGRWDEYDLWFHGGVGGTAPRAYARSSAMPGAFVSGWDSIAVGLCEAERRARALGLVDGVLAGAVR